MLIAAGKFKAQCLKIMDDVHGDPADRLILTTAKNIHAAIMTADVKMIDHCQHHGLAIVSVL